LTYRRTDDHPYRSLSLDERHLAFFLEGEHDGRKGKGERLSRPGESDADHVSA
jgi:hypothetical protein